MEHQDTIVENGQNNPFHFEGDRNEKLNELFEKDMSRLFRVADRILHNRYDSEDALQDGLLSALRHLDQFKGNSQFSTWMYSIIRNSALAKVRRQKLHPFVSIDDQSSEPDPDIARMEVPTYSGPDPERACAQSELATIFESTLQCLPPHYRAIIRLCDFEGFTGKEAAEQLGLTVAALKAQHNRARSAIRESMGSQFAKIGI